MTAGTPGGSSKKGPRRTLPHESLIPGWSFEDVHELLLDRQARDGVSLDCLRRLALNCVAGRRMELAERFLQRIRESSVSEEQFFEYFTTLGRIQRGLGRLDEALESYQRALTWPAADPLVYRVRCHIANCLYRLGRATESEEACRVAIVALPDRCEAFVELGQCLKSQGRWFEAGKVFMTAIGKNPYDGEAHFSLDELLDEHPELREELVYCGVSSSAAVRSMLRGPWNL